jgi:hypothetical protein
MNQRSLYETLEKAGYKILSFEDYPSNHGSWRVNFMNTHHSCEVSANRFDGYISVRAKNGIDEKKYTINSLRFLTDEAELAAVIRWLRLLSSPYKTNNNKASNNKSLLSA